MMNKRKFVGEMINGNQRDLSCVMYRKREMDSVKRRRKVTNCTFIRFVSIILALIMFLGVTPLEAVYAQDVPEVMEINVYRTFQDLSDRGTYGISVSGKGLSRVNISYQEEATDEFIPLTNHCQEVMIHLDNLE